MRAKKKECSDNYAKKQGKRMETKNFEKFTSTQTKIIKIKTIQTFFSESIDFFLLIQLL